jgi:subtilisin-like proprotein convertase family protein
MKKNLLFSFFMMIVFSGGFAQNLWNETTAERLSSLSKMDRASNPLDFKLYSLNYEALKSQLSIAPSRENESLVSNVIIQFPNANGSMSSYRMYEASVMHPDLAARYPDIKSYVGIGIEDKTANLRLSTTIFGMHAMVLSGNKETSYIDTYTKDLQNYIVYNKSSLRTSRTWSCMVEDAAEEIGTVSGRSTNESLASDGQFRTYRLAMACTIEYAAYHITAAGIAAIAPLATKKAAVLAAMNVTMTRLNGVYESDMSLRMQLVANNDIIIFVNSDSFTNDDANSLINESQTVIDANIGAANYDIGHTVSTGGGGLAQSPSVCVAGSKARGITGSPAPVGDPFDIDFVAHEIGHQFGASHTFNGIGGNCTTGTRSNNFAVEPGSGTTIMAYAGICSGVDVQPNSDDHFHAVSIGQMVSHINGAGSCAVSVANGNTPPTITPLVNYTIPNGTAFVLRGVATDANNDSLTYCWEQTNNNISTQPPVSTSTTGPNFRSLSPSTSPNRFFPNFQSVLAGNLAPTWEVVPTVQRAMTFALTVRDNRTPNGGQTSRADMTVNFASVGPFRVTNPDVTNLSWTQGSTQVISWDVAGSTANGINTANVNILLSTDGGVTFTTVLASNTPNDGTQSITLPNVAAPYCRIMIESVGNIFYAVSKSFSLGYLVTVTNICNNYTASPASPIAAQNPLSWQVAGSVNVPDNLTISDMNVSLNINHTRINDLYIGVLKPGASTVGEIRILYQQGCSALISSNMVTTFDDAGATLNCGAIAGSNVYRPLNSLDIFNGQSSLGSWRIVIADVATANNGTLNSFNFNICSTTVTETLLNEEFEINEFVIYPNPSKGVFNIQFNSNSNNDINLNVYDMRGRNVHQDTFSNNGLINESINLENLQSGIYLVEVQDGLKKVTKKIVKE